MGVAFAFTSFDVSDGDSPSHRDDTSTLADAAATDKIAVIDMGVFEIDLSGISEVVNIVQVGSLTGSSSD